MKSGDKVAYIPYKDAPEDEWQRGIIKSIQDEKHAFVVYKCNDKWENYEDYTAARTSIDDLNLGWPMTSSEVIETVEQLLPSPTNANGNKT